MLFTLTPAARPDGYGEGLIPLAQAKAWLRVLHDDEDDLIRVLRDMGLDMVEQYTGTRLAPTSLTVTFDSFGDDMPLPVGPAASIVVSAIGYVPPAGGSASVSAWRVDPLGRLQPALGAVWPAGASRVTVAFTAGFAAGTVPAALLTAARMFMAVLYDQRETLMSDGVEADLPRGFRALCGPWRRVLI